MNRHPRVAFGLGSPPSAGVFAWLRRLISARREDWSCLRQRRHFPTSWGTDCAHGACLPGTSRGCRNSVTPDTLSSSSLRLTRVMPLFGSARYEQWLCRMYGGQVAHRSMGGERSVANRHIPPQILYVTLDLHSLVGGVSPSSFPGPPPDTAERYTGRS